MGISKTAYLQNDNSITKTYPTNYALNSDGTGQIMQRFGFYLNGYTLVPESIGTPKFVNYLHPYYRQKTTPAVGVYNYNFSLHPKEMQPSSACNFTSISEPAFYFTFDPNAFTYKLSDIYPHIVKDSVDDAEMTTTLEGQLYSVKMTVLRIIGGFAGVAIK